MPPRLLHPFSKPAKESFRQLVRADGVRVWDADGNEYIDGMASLWYCQVGYGRPEIVDAVTNQLNVMAAYNTFDPWGNPPAEQVAERIAGVSPHPDGRVFLCCSGSESVDSAFKLTRKVAQLKGETDRQIVVRRTRGYHGVNAGGTSLQGIEPNREGWGDLVPHVMEIDPDDIESAARLFAEHGDKIAGVITEPVQGAGGVFPPAPDYLRRLRELCDKHGALLVFDEVICGFGRTGEWFASNTYDVVPDLMTFAKGVTSGYQPMGGVIVSRGVCDVLESDPDFILRHGYTYSGHPARSGGGVGQHRHHRKRRPMRPSLTKSESASRQVWPRLESDGDIASFRGVGAVWAARLPEGSDATRSVAVRDTMLDHGVIFRPIGDSLAFCPPLVINDADIDKCVDVLATSIKANPLLDLFDLMSPTAHGGANLDLDTFFEVGVRLGEADASHAWVLCFYIEHVWMLHQFPEAFQQELFADRTHVQTESGLQTLFFAMPTADVSIEDTWHTDGMRGTGSNDIVVDDVFVPIERTADIGAMSNVGSELYEGPLWSTPMMPILEFAASLPVLGQARFAVSEFARQLQGRTDFLGLTKKTEDPVYQRRLGAAHLEVQAAEALMRKVTGRGDGPAGGR
ncbi:Putrescine--pyruvate aminotransferase [Nymphon striatum]|nr:Putrescine--pyruvate aminotransferase [Nymphon striatum]